MSEIVTLGLPGALGARPWKAVTSKYELLLMDKAFQNQQVEKAGARKARNWVANLKAGYLTRHTANNPARRQNIDAPRSGAVLILIAMFSVAYKR
jgi:hypothetical protein